MQFHYGHGEEQNVVAVQLKMLQLLSAEAHQNITVHCRNMVAYRDQKSGLLKKALVLRGSNGQELRAQGNARLRYTVIEDGCSVSPRRTFWCELKRRVISWHPRTPPPEIKWTVGKDGDPVQKSDGCPPPCGGSGTDGHRKGWPGVRRGRRSRLLFLNQRQMDRRFFFIGPKSSETTELWVSSRRPRLHKPDKEPEIGRLFCHLLVTQRSR